MTVSETKPSSVLADASGRGSVLNPLREADFVSRAREITGLIGREAVSTESGGTLSASSVEALRDTELFWMLVPRELGGGGVNLTTAILAIEEISCADGSSGWVLMANSTMTAIASAFCGEAAIDAMFSNGRRAVTAGMFGPGGKSVEVTDGYVGGGRFSFASGSNHADWISAGMLVLDGGQPRRLANGQPEVRVCFVPRSKVKFLGNWDVTGLAGTGSYDYEVPEQHIGRDFTLERTADTPLRGGSVFSLGLAAFACAGHAAVAIGLMRRALAEIVQTAATKARPGYTGVVGDSQLFREEFSTNEAAFQAARAYVLQVFGDAQDAVAAGRVLTAEQRARFRQATTWTHRVAADVVRFCYFWSGTSAIREKNVMGRCMRDIHVATQHVFVDPISLVDAAPALMGAWGNVPS